MSYKTKKNIVGYIFLVPSLFFMIAVHYTLFVRSQPSPASVSCLTNKKSQ